MVNITLVYLGTYYATVKIFGQIFNQVCNKYWNKEIKFVRKVGENKVNIGQTKFPKVKEGQIRRMVV